MSLLDAEPSAGVVSSDLLVSVQFEAQIVLGLQDDASFAFRTLRLALRTDWLTTV